MRIVYLVGLVLAVILAISGCPLSQGSEPETDTLNAPQFAHDAGTYTGSVSLEITSPDGADIWYALGNSDPLNNGQVYTSPVSLSDTVTVYAVAVKDGWENSPVASVEYTIVTTQNLDAPVITPSGGSYSGSVTVQMSSPDGAEILYSTDLSDPSSGGSRYTAGFTLTETTVVKAVAHTDALGYSSVTTVQFIILQDTVADPVDSFFWGRWTRMDQLDEWVISDRDVVTATGTLDVSTSTTDTISLNSGIQLAKTTDNVITVTDGSDEYRLIRQRNMGTMRGRLVAQTTTTPLSAQGISTSSGGLSGLGGIDVILTNIDNPSNTETVTTDSEGQWESTEIIPGEEYLVEPVLGDLQSDYEVVQESTVTVKEDGEDVGNIIFTTEPYNFQTDYTMGTEFLYADGSTYFPITMTVRNVGSETNLGTNYQLSGDSGLTVICDSNNGTLTDAIGSIPPDTEKSLSLRVRCEPITDSWEDKRVNITLTSADNHVWEDSISLRFYKTRSTINLYSVNAGVNGFIRTPEGRTIDYRTTWDGQKYSGEVDVPYYSGFVFAFCGADLGTESKYSFGIDREPEDATTMNAFYNTAAYEPNDDEFDSISVATDDVVMSYLHVTDYDFFAINESKTAMPVFTTRGTEFGTGVTPPITTEITCATDGASIYYTTDGSEPTEASGISYTEGDIIVIPGTRNLKARAFKNGFEPSAIAEEQYVFPTGITVGFYDRLIPGDFYSMVEFDSDYEKWFMIDIEDGGSFSFKMDDLSDGSGGASVDVSAALFDATLTTQVFNNVDDSYLTPTVCELEPGTYYLLLSSNFGQASGVCAVKLY